MSTPKTCLVTGGTSGIGAAIVAGLLARGHRVVVVGRDAEKGRAFVAGREALSFLAANLSSQASIRALAAEVERTQPLLSVLVNNVGASFWERQTTVDGLERTLATNLLAPFLLTRLLLPLLERSAPSRIVNVATRPRASDTLVLEDLQSEKGYSGFSAYGRAKTGVIAWTGELARRLEGKGVTVNCFQPGIVAGTAFMDNMPWVMRKLGPLFARLTPMRVTAEEAADTGVWLALDEVGAAGAYFEKRKQMDSLPQTRDPVVAQRLWEACERLVGEHSP